MLVKDVMRSEVIHIGSPAILHEAAELMLARGVDTLLVMEDEQLLGVIGLRDLFTAPLSASYGNRMNNLRSEQDLFDIWQKQTVGNVMNDRVLTVTDEMPLMSAAALMVNSGKHPLPVTHDGKVVGMIARTDVVRALLASQGI
jgi:CBS domain-containing protein